METLFWVPAVTGHYHHFTLIARAQQQDRQLLGSFCPSQRLALADLLLVEVTHAKFNAGHWFDQILLSLLTVFTEDPPSPQSLVSAVVQAFPLSTVCYLQM